MKNVYLDSLQGQSANHFAIIGDTQRSMGYQKLMFREWDNHHERSTLLKDIAAQNLDGRMQWMVCIVHHPHH